MPLGSKTELEQFPTGYGGCLQAVMVSPVLVGQQREKSALEPLMHLQLVVADQCTKDKARQAQEWSEYC